jgi:hypothetical protein
MAAEWRQVRGTFAFFVEGQLGGGAAVSIRTVSLFIKLPRALMAWKVVKCGAR